MAAPAGFPWHLGIHDAHCHPTDTMAQASPAGTRAATLTIMSTRSQDQHLVAEMAAAHPDPRATSRPGAACAVVPAFGWHPWFSHELYDDGEHDAAQGTGISKAAHYRAVLQPAPAEEEPALIASLPDPTPLSAFLAQTRRRLEAFPAALVGEVGLDKAFRLPREWDGATAAARDESLTPGGREGRPLSGFRVSMGHQRRVLEAQLRLAGELGRAASVHGVQAHGVLYDTVAGLWRGHERRVLSRREKRMDRGEEESEEEESEEEEEEEVVSGGKPYPPRICLHSYSGSAEMLRQWLHPAVPCKVYVSLSTAVNLGGGRGRLEEVVMAVPDERVLVESDVHAVGGPMDAALEDMYRVVCEIKGWELASGVRRIGNNYEHFIYG